MQPNEAATVVPISAASIQACSRAALHHCHILCTLQHHDGWPENGLHWGHLPPVVCDCGRGLLQSARPLTLLLGVAVLGLPAAGVKRKAAAEEVGERLVTVSSWWQAAQVSTRDVCSPTLMAASCMTPLEQGQAGNGGREVWGVMLHAHDHISLKELSYR